MSIAVFLESYNGKLVKAAKEAIGVAKSIGSDVFGIAIDNNVDAVIEEAGKLGLSTVKAAAGITIYHPAMYSRIIFNAAKDADVVIFPGTVWGREISPQVCVKMDATPVSDIIEVVDASTFKRSLHGNKIHATVKAEGKIVLTVRAGIFDVPELGDGTANREEITSEVAEGDAMIKLAEILASSSDRVELTEADIIVSGGRGIGEATNFKLIEDLATELGAAVGASRAIVDAGMRPHSEQVGQTGKFVAPKLYIAVGISGAIQHLAGMSSSETIVAINKDEEAPIFKIADYGLVGDLFEVMPKLIEAVKAAKKSA